MNKQALIELAKSFGRFIYFGLLGLVATFLVSLAANQDLMNWVICFGDICLQVGVAIIAAAGFVAKAIDRYIHTNKDIDANGIAPKFLQR